MASARLAMAESWSCLKGALRLAIVAEGRAGFGVSVDGKSFIRKEVGVVYFG